MQSVILLLSQIADSFIRTNKTFRLHCISWNEFFTMAKFVSNQVNSDVETHGIFGGFIYIINNLNSPEYPEDDRNLHGAFLICMIRS